MTVDSNQFPNSSEDMFVTAVERLEAGEALESVLATFPEEERANLRELLTIVAATHHLQEIDIPRPTVERRKKAKEEFLRNVTEMKVTTATAGPTVAPPVVKSVATSVATVTWGEKLANWWVEFTRGLAPMSMRLAPLAIMVIAIWLGAFSVVSVAQAAIPGDIIYSAKTWSYEQRITLSDVEDRGQIYTEYTTTLAADSKRAIDRAAEQKTIVKTTSVPLLISSVGQNQIAAGGLTFALGYQESLSATNKVPTRLEGLPIVDAQAIIEYQMVPQTIDANGNVVPEQYQAISIKVIEAPIVMPTVEPTPVVTTPPVTSNGCTAAPDGWVPYVVPAGSTLSGIATAAGVPINTLVRYNCIENVNMVRAGETIMVPRLPAVATATPTQPAAATPTELAVTLTAISTTQLTPSLTITAPVVITPTTAVTATATMSATDPVATDTPEATATVSATLATATVEPTVLMTATVAPSMTPTGTLAVPTTTPEVVVTETPVETAAATPAVTAEETLAVTPGPSGTPEPTVEGADAEPTATPVESATVEATSANPPAPMTATPETAATATTDNPPEPTMAGDEGTTGGQGETGEVTGASGTGDDNAVPTDTPLPPAPPTPFILPTATPTPANQSPLTGG